MRTSLAPSSAPSSPDDAAPGFAGVRGADLLASPLPRISVQVFCETPEVAAACGAAAADRRFDKVQLKIHMGGAPAAAEAYRDAPTPNVIVVESMAGGPVLLAALERLAEVCDKGTKVVVIGHVNDVLLYRELVRRGVSEYVIAPLDTLGFMRTLSDLFHAPGADPIGRTIAVVGAKGGVGASTLAHNLAFSITRGLGLAAVIADLDLAFGTAGLDFNQDPPQGIAEAVFAPDRLDANLVDRLLAKCSERLSLLAAPATLERSYDLEELSFDGVFDILRGMTPFVVLDLPHSWTSWSRRALVGADEILLVAEPDLANLRNAKNILDTLSGARPHDRRPHVVLNRVGVPKRPEISPPEFAKALGVELAAVIASDAALFGAAANNGQMLSEVQATAKAAEAVNALARLLTGRAEPRKVKAGMLDPLLARFRKTG